MSYCRFSCLNFSSDVYCWADVGGGYVAHIASGKLARPEECPSVPGLRDKVSGEVWLEARKRQHEYLESALRVPIDHPMAGERIWTETAAEMADRLEQLQREGITVPQYAIDLLREEED